MRPELTPSGVRLSGNHGAGRFDRLQQLLKLASLEDELPSRLTSQNDKTGRFSTQYEALVRYFAAPATSVDIRQPLLISDG